MSNPLWVWKNPLVFLKKPCPREREILNLYLWTHSLMQRASQRGRIWLAGWGGGTCVFSCLSCEWLWTELSGKSGARPLVRSPAGVRELPAISSLSWHLLAFRRDVHLSSSLINNYSVCGPPDRPCILMTAWAEAGREGWREWSERRWSGVEWSGVKGECKMGSVSCIFWLKAQDAAPEQQIRVSGLVFKCSGWLITGAAGGEHWCNTSINW